MSLEEITPAIIAKEACKILKKNFNVFRNDN